RASVARRERVPRSVLPALPEALRLGPARRVAHRVLRRALVLRAAPGDVEQSRERVLRDAPGGLGHRLARGLSGLSWRGASASVSRHAELAVGAARGRRLALRS